MTIEKIEVWRTSDGQLHHTPDRAERHELNLTVRQKLLEFCERRLTCLSMSDRGGVADILAACSGELLSILGSKRPEGFQKEGEG